MKSANVVPPSEGLHMVPASEVEVLFRKATDVAGVCKELAIKASSSISGRKYVRVEGWMAIATAHGCCASARDVERVPGGIRAIAEIKRMSDGMVLCTAEGFVGEDEVTWFGGQKEEWDQASRSKVMKTVPKRAEYAIRAMAQTRAISRACRTAFAHVVVLMDADLQTTPAEEVPEGGFPASRGDAGDVHEGERTRGGTATEVKATEAKAVCVPRDVGNITEEERAQFKEGKWRAVVVHFGKNKGVKLGDMEERQLAWYAEEWEPKPFGGAKTLAPDDRILRAALDAYLDEETLRRKNR